MTTVVLDHQRTVTVDNSGTVPQITIASLGLQGPQGLPTTVNGHTGSTITLTSADVGAIPTTQKGAASGVATLDASSLVPIAQIPVNALSANFVDLSTAQTVNGVKSFGSIPVGPASDPTTGNQLARKAYVDLMLPIAGGTMTGNIVLVGDPTAALHPATKQYVDAYIQGASSKGSCRCATVAALPANTYANGTSGVGATLTATANGALGTIDGASPGVGDRILVKNEAAAANNGVYTITQAGDGTHPYILTRATDVDTASHAAGAYVFIEGGSTNAGSGWTLPIIPANLTVGTTAQNWTQFSGAGEITAGTGLTKTGNTIALATPVSIANGGTGSATQNFVDLTTNQSIAGTKTFTTGIAVNTGGTAVAITGTAVGQRLLGATGTDVTSVALAAGVTGESFDRLRVTADGGYAVGPGTVTRDTFWGRAGVGIMYTSKTLLVGASATLGTGGVGVLELANAATNPTANPTGGGVLYSKSAVPVWLDTGGNTLGMSRTYDVAATSDLFSFTTETDIPGCSIATIKVTGSNATVIIDGTFDMQMNSSAGNLVGYCNWNGADQTRQAIFVAGASGNRATTGQVWRITGVAAGTYTAKLRASCNSSGAANGIRGTHTSMVVQVIEN